VLLDVVKHASILYNEVEELNTMEDMILSVSTLPEQLHRRFRSDRVRVHEENGAIVLTPVLDAQRDTCDDLENIRKRRVAAKGCLKGKVWMSDDFDDPIEDMKEYME